MDEKLLLDLFKIPAASGNEAEIQEYIKKWLSKENIEYFEDSIGNIYNISHDNRPLLSAHMDTVQDDLDEHLASLIEIKEGRVSGYGVIGGDDKCGIYAILHLLKNGHKDNVNFVFSVQEEVGAIGSSLFEETNDLTKMLYCLVLDRKGSSDILCDLNHDYGVKEFSDALTDFGSAYGFSQSTGTFCDADNYNEQLSCANISVGYYNAHTKNEYAVISELENSIKFINSVISNLDVKYKAPDVGYSYGGHYGAYSTYSDDEWENYLEKWDDDETKAKTITNDSDYFCSSCNSIKATRTIKSLGGLSVCEYCYQDLVAEIYETEEDSYIMEG